MFRLHAPAPFRSDRSWSFGVPPEQLWERISDVGDYRAWWPWLTTFSTVGGFGSGARWQCVVSPPLPYEVRFAVLLEHVEPACSVAARVVGDVTGDALLEIDPTGSGCTARLRSELAPAHPVLRSVGAAARPVVEWGHDWVLDQGRRQFVAAALRDDPHAA